MAENVLDIIWVSECVCVAMFVSYERWQENGRRQKWNNFYIIVMYDC